MPPRTNEKQQIIEMVKKLLAPQGCTVTASRMLLDRELDEEREVDVVAETSVDGHLFTQSFEVVGRGRPMDIGWVDGMIRKHETLPTDRLYLVSWSGFTEAALKRAQGTPRVFSVTVEPVPAAASLYADQIHLALKQIKPIVRLPDGRQFGVQFVPDLGIFSNNGQVLGTVWQLGSWIVQLPLLGKALLEQLHAHRDRESVRWFQLELPLNAVPFDNLYVRLERTDEHGEELQHIVGLNLVGEVRFEQQPVDLSIKTFQAEMFGHGEVVLGGVRHLIVASVGESAEVKAVRVEANKSGK